MKARELLVVDAEMVRERLDYPNCIAAVREAMAALSAGTTHQLLRTMIHMGEGRTFAQMPGALGDDQMFGAKLISVFADPARPGRRRHRGLVVMFEPTEGRPVAVVDAEEVTHIRTAAATAMATDALARADAETLFIVGTGGQAHTHLKALPHVRDFRRILIWGRDPAKAQALAAEFGAEAVTDVREAAGQSDVICTVTGAAEPVLLGAWLKPGAHVNLVGSSAAGPTEVDNDLVARGRYFVESRASALAAAAEFIHAKAAGLIDDSHIVGEIGEVLLGRVPARTADGDITIYKSLGHAVQDLAAASILIRSLTD